MKLKNLVKKVQSIVHKKKTQKRINNKATWFGDPAPKQHGRWWWISVCSWAGLSHQVCARHCLQSRSTLSEPAKGHWSLLLRLSKNKPCSCITCMVMCAGVRGACAMMPWDVTRVLSDVGSLVMSPLHTPRSFSSVTHVANFLWLLLKSRTCVYFKQNFYIL